MQPHYQEVPEQAEQTPAEPDALESRIGSAHPLKAGAPNQMHDTPLYTQGDKPDCLLQSARMTEHKQTGQDPGLEAYKQPAIDKGLYDFDGTKIKGFEGVINERPAVQGELKKAAGPEEIKDALDHDRSVVGVVDAYEFYKDQFNLEPNSGCHAIVVTGADQTPDGLWQFTVNDPNDATPNIPVDGERFLRAWDQTGRPMFVMQKRGGGQ